ncbi:MAG TPA: selenide, water dikinase SelD, partial [Candidatus Paceibacterota bacterium]|nr:selenide, water dikinase SelD [Candidatus Paceibacterota bacterium]
MKVDVAKRRQVMERSQALGHCICNPRQPCPCDIFRSQGICPCAGERPDPVDLSQFKLTDHVRNAGCASKIAPGDLEAVLARLPAVTDPAVVSGLAAGDDAAIYRISEHLHLVQTVDVFTPCVDDPFLFGRICAANCLSDIYAMGGIPRTALSILCFPSETLDGEIMYRMLAGAMATLAEASVSLIGGHSIKDEEIKLGFAITGTIDAAVAAALERPQIGDLLVLTKALGTGVLTFCQQIGRAHGAGLSAAAASMAALNKPAAEAMIAAGASACTDITGFGLWAHLLRQLRSRKLSAQIWASSLPALPGSREAFAQGIVPGAVERNREYVGDSLQVESGVDEALVNLGFDAQTSGGLLIAIAASKAPRLIQELANRQLQGHIIGRITAEGSTPILVTRSAESDGRIHLQVPPMNPTPNSEASQTPPASACCCSPEIQPPETASTADEAARGFGALMRAVQAGGALNPKTKELILFSLVLLSRCEPCFAIHYRKALEMGITESELDEAAWCAVSMGGAPVRLFYQEGRKNIATHQ